MNQTLAAPEPERASAEQATTFRQVAEAYVSIKRSEWKNEKHDAQWMSSLRTYAFPTLGEMAVSKIGIDEVLAVLNPIWNQKTETASRVRGRIEKILDFAKAKRLRSGENPAAWRNNLSAVLGAPARIAPVEHYAAMDWRECPGFMEELKGRRGASALALRFTILTAARTGMTIGTCWREIDLEGREWVIPGGRMKGHRSRPDFYVALSPGAMDVLESCRLPDAQAGAFECFNLSGGSPSVLERAAFRV